MIGDGALFANQRCASATEIFLQLLFVSWTVWYFLAVGVRVVDHEIVLWDFVIGGAGAGDRFEFRVAQIKDAMALEAVHELVRHHAVRTEEIRTVEATSYSVGFGWFATGATNSNDGS